MCSAVGDDAPGRRRRQQPLTHPCLRCRRAIALRDPPHLSLRLGSQGQQIVQREGRDGRARRRYAASASHFPSRRCEVTVVADPICQPLAGRLSERRSEGRIGPPLCLAYVHTCVLGCTQVRNHRGAVGMAGNPRQVGRPLLPFAPGRSGALLDEAMAAALAGEADSLDAVVLTSCRTITSCGHGGEVPRATQWIRAADDFNRRYGSPHLYATYVVGALSRAHGERAHRAPTIPELRAQVVAK